MPDFSRVIHLAYQRILGRPADASGLDNYNRLMNAGLSEADMRESLLRSPEYADKNPSGPTASSIAARGRKRRKTRGRKKSQRGR